jgi:hypothetical protein
VADFLNNRHYQPSLAVFLSVDPLHVVTGEPYSYAGGQPIAASDPTGLCTLFQSKANGSYECGFYPRDGEPIFERGNSQAGGWRDDFTPTGDSLARGCDLALGTCTTPDESWPLDAVRFFVADDRECFGDGASVAGCSIQVLGIIPIGKAARLLRIFRGADEAVTGIRLADNATEAALLDELAANGIRHDPQSVIRIARNDAGQIVFLEAGNTSAGLEHIIVRHADDFARRGVELDQIPDLVIRAATEGRIVGYQGAGIGRPVFEVTFNGVTHRIAITIGSNGFIVGANPA